jgi:hypothetical protein
MRNAITPDAPKRKPFNIAMDEELKGELQSYCKKNRKAGEPSDVIEDEIIRLIARKGRKYGLRVPKHLS